MNFPQRRILFFSPKLCFGSQLLAPRVSALHLPRGASFSFRTSSLAQRLKRDSLSCDQKCEGKFPLRTATARSHGLVHAPTGKRHDDCRRPGRGDDPRLPADFVLVVVFGCPQPNRRPAAADSTGHVLAPDSPASRRLAGQHVAAAILAHHLVLESMRRIAGQAFALVHDGAEDGSGRSTTDPSARVAQTRRLRSSFRRTLRRCTGRDPRGSLPPGPFPGRIQRPRRPTTPVRVRTR